MQLIIDYVLNQDGAVIGRIIADTTDAGFIATMTACKGNPNAQKQAGFSDSHNVPGRPVGETKWQLLVALSAQLSVTDAIKKLNLA